MERWESRGSEWIIWSWRRSRYEVAFREGDLRVVMDKVWKQIGGDSSILGSPIVIWTSCALRKRVMREAYGMDEVPQEWLI